ncbi:hypothetical protein ACFQ1S_19990, partial [Kibdelosporangium lantanae]
HEADTVIDAANAISGLVRYMNNATQYRHTLQYAPQVTHILVAAGAEKILADTDSTNVPMAANFAKVGYPITQERVFLAPGER